MELEAAWIAGAAGIFGAILGASAEAFRTRQAFRQDRAWDLFLQDRQRIEQLYVTVGRVRESYGHSAANALLMLVQGKALPEAKAHSVPWARLDMLVALYAPHLREHFRVVRDAGEAVGAQMGGIVMKLPGTRETNSREAALLVERTKALDSAVASMQMELSTHAKQLREAVLAEVPHPLLARIGRRAAV